MNVPGNTKIKTSCIHHNNISQTNKPKIFLVLSRRMKNASRIFNFF